jgi:TonB-dependent SusC/RagA subfamily outer membrane receptor
MWLNSSRTSLALVSHILVCGSTLVTLTGCYRRTSALDEVAPAEAAVATGQRADQPVRQFPGIQIVSTRYGGFYISILGAQVGDGLPLYVIDGAHIVVDPGTGIHWFKPEDMMQITVLKTPVETSVYGPSGVNGVILITTKLGVGRRK